MQKTKIAFDLDGVIINKPPLVPKSLIERLFRGNSEEKLRYRFPRSKLEQRIRKISHFYLFRPPIKDNINFIKKIAEMDKFELYVISGRYSFLESETKNWLKKRQMNSVFKKIFLNLGDEQPHLFKEKILNKLHPDIYIDDDGAIVKYLRQNISSAKIIHYFPGVILEDLLDKRTE